MSDEGRKRLIREFGDEVVVECCREWKTHYGDGKFGKCGICHKNPTIKIGKTWDN